MSKSYKLKDGNYIDKSAIIRKRKRLGLINLLGDTIVTGVTSGTIDLVDSVQYYDMLIFQIGAVGAYNFSNCIAMPFPSQFRNNDNENYGWRTSDTIKLNFLNGSTATYITLKLNSYTQLEIVSNPSNLDIRGVIGLNI